VGLERRARAERAGRLDHDVDAEVPPGDRAGDFSLVVAIRRPFTVRDSSSLWISPSKIPMTVSY
jgi:hypothetical protein